jgi:hypothetical protein
VEHLTWLVILVLTTTSTIKRAVVWDNKFILAYGLSKIKGDSKTAKTDDRLELNSLWGKKKMAGDWYYYVFNFKSQMDTGYDKNMVKISHFSHRPISNWVQVCYGKSDNLSVNFLPLRQS